MRLKSIENLQEFVNSIEQSLKAISSGYTSGFGDTKSALEDIKHLFLSKCKFKVGDLVALKQEIVVEKGSGWAGCTHFMYQGSPAVVKEVWYVRDYKDPTKGDYMYYVTFDDETWVDKYGDTHLVDEKALFMIAEGELVPR